MKNFFVYFVLFVLLIITSVLSSYGQYYKSYQQYQGCSQSPYSLGKNAYIDVNNNGILEENESINIIETGQSRFTFTFRIKNPNPDTKKFNKGVKDKHKVVFNKGEEIIFETFPYGKDSDSNNYDILKALQDVSNANGFYLGMSPLGTVSSQGQKWYAIMQKAEFNAGNKIVYPEYLMSLNSPLTSNTAQSMPPFRALFDGTVRFGPATSDTNKINVKAFELDGDNEPRLKAENLKNLDAGYYWVTLQTTARFEGQNSRECPKTTPPVLVQIVDDQLNVELYGNYFVSFKNPVISRPGEKPFTPPALHEFRATITGGSGEYDLAWYADDDVDLSNCPKTTKYKKVSCSIPSGPYTKLKEGGKYYIKLEVTDKRSGEKAVCDVGNGKCGRLAVNSVPKVDKIEFINSYTDPVTIKANVSDIESPREDLYWTVTNVTDGDGNVINVSKKTVGDPSTSDYKEELTFPGQIPVIYKVEVTVDDKLDTYSKPDSPTTAPDSNVIYFQFDEPMKGRRLSDPELWVGKYKDRSAYTQREQCQQPYPDYDFRSLFDLEINKPSFEGLLENYPLTSDNIKLFSRQLTTGKIPLSNTEKLNKIIEDLKTAENSNGNSYNVQIVGYTDFKAGAGYNTELAERRIKAVRDYLERELSKYGISLQIYGGGRNTAKDNTITVSEVTNQSDFGALSCDYASCNSGRRYDRRVEIYYFKDQPFPIRKLDRDIYQCSKKDAE